MTNNRVKIFVSAYACEPNLGSEIGVGWHWVLEMSVYFELWVLTRASNRDTIECWINEHPEYEGIHFLYFDLPQWAKFWKKGLRGVRTYYTLWQYGTNAIVKNTMLKNNIEIFHHLTYGNVLWKVSSYGQKQFFIWGPVGGVETISSEFTKHYNCKSRMVERIRRVAVKMLCVNYGFKRRCRKANLILCKTDITRLHIPVQYREKAMLFTDVATDELVLHTKDSQIKNHAHIEFLTVGRLDAWRGFDLIIEAFARAVKEVPDIHLTLVGKGGDGKRLSHLIGTAGLEEHVTMVGAVSQEQYYAWLNQSDVVINASLKEGAVTVSFDTMAKGKPLICIDTTGYTRYFSDKYAIVIPVRSRERVIEDLKSGILLLTKDSLRFRMGVEARNAGEQFTWKSRGKEIYALISDQIRKKQNESYFRRKG